MRYFKFVVALFLLIIVQNIWGQDSKEFRYLSIKLGLVNNFVFSLEENLNLLARTPLGDMALEPRDIINYTPGASFSILYNIDAYNDKLGFVFGVQAQNYGYSIQYISKDSNFVANDMFRASSVVIPLYIKFNPKSIFINQTYLTIGFKQYYNIDIKEYQTGSWLSSINIKQLEMSQVHHFTTGVFVGFNYNLGFVELEYNLNSFINKDFSLGTEDGTVRPFSNINSQMRIYLTAGFNFPINRWLSVRSWTAERIRRIFASNK